MSDLAFDPVIRKLTNFAVLGEAEQTALGSLEHEVVMPPDGTYLVREGSAPKAFYALLDGFACRSKSPGGGRNQILSFHTPGDIFDLCNLLTPVTDSNVITIGRTTVAKIPMDALRMLKSSYAQIGNALWADTLLDAAIYREWVVNIGRRAGLARVAHLCAEFSCRRSTAMPDAPKRFRLPFTQTQIGDATGLTPIHVNRKIGELEKLGAFVRRAGKIMIEDDAILREVSNFNPTYLEPLGLKARQQSASFSGPEAA